jgi:DNA-binding CsgD family transcriptional regulator
MSGLPYSVCACSSKSRRAAELVASGASDQAVADRLGVGRMAVQRHAQITSSHLRKHWSRLLNPGYFENRSFSSVGSS